MPFYVVCEKKQYSIAYIPPYSPDYNPIENIFSIVKKQYRKLNLDHRLKQHYIIRSCVQSLKPHAFHNIFRRWCDRNIRLNECHGWRSNHILFLCMQRVPKRCTPCNKLMNTRVRPWFADGFTTDRMWLAPPKGPFGIPSMNPCVKSHHEVVSSHPFSVYAKGAKDVHAMQTCQ
jgi:hypothetical protein